MMVYGVEIWISGSGVKAKGEKNSKRKAAAVRGERDLALFD